MHIVQACPGNCTHSTAALAAELDTVAPSSLSRRVPLRARASFVQVVAEWGVRAGSERTDMLRADAAQMKPHEIAAVTAEPDCAALLADAADVIEDVERHLDAARSIRSRPVSAVELLRGG